MRLTDPWERLGARAEPGAEACGYTHDDHVHDGVGLACVRLPGHAGAVVAVNTHLAELHGEPVFFGDPLVIADPIDDRIMP